MAKNKCTVFLGFEDEEVTENHKTQLNFMTNKVGGLADWANSGINVPNCPICNLNRPLILQIYAPLENSQFHRSLYIFACLNPPCSVISKSWLCIRSQVYDKSQESAVSVPVKTSTMNISWCNGADDWGEDDDAQKEENGNVIKNDNRVSDDDDDSNSMENDILCGFANINVDDKNANCGAQGGAADSLSSSNIFAEIEGEESEIVTIETPIVPERDLVALLKQTSGIPSQLNNLTLKSFFITVDEERASFSNYLGLSDHVRELIQEYQIRDNNCKSSPNSPVSASATDSEQEAYEKVLPAHGDVAFHNFMTTIQKNPGQIIRYSRDNFPLLIAPITESIPKCQHCGGESICEIQILPTIISKLKMENGDPAPIEFGNALIFTCLKSCWDTPDKMRFEHVVVQQEH